MANSTKFLGIIIDKNLIFRDHINYISSKISKSIDIIYRLNYFLPPEILKLLHNSQILPYFSYLAPWYVSNRVQTTSHSHTNYLSKINKFFKLDDIYKSNLCSHLFYYQNINNNNNIHEHNTSLT